LDGDLSLLALNFVPTRLTTTGGITKLSILKAFTIRFKALRVLAITQYQFVTNKGLSIIIEPIVPIQLKITINRGECIPSRHLQLHTPDTARPLDTHLVLSLKTRTLLLVTLFKALTLMIDFDLVSHLPAHVRITLV